MLEQWEGLRGGELGDGQPRLAEKSTSLWLTSVREPTKASSQPSRPSVARRGTRSQLFPTSSMASVRASGYTPNTGGAFGESKREAMAVCRVKGTVRKL